jgi:peptidoglycan/LPS O-acetylase OafA/YrhL
MTLSSAPAQVRKAFVLLWAAFGISLADGVAHLLLEPPDKEVAIEMWGFTVVAFAAGAYFIYSASRRRNWARIVLLVVTLVTIAAYVAWPVNWTDQPWWSATVATVCALAEVVAL